MHKPALIFSSPLLIDLLHNLMPVGILCAPCMQALCPPCQGANALLKLLEQTSPNAVAIQVMCLSSPYGAVHFKY